VIAMRTTIAATAADLASQLRSRLASTTGVSWTVAGPYINGDRVLYDGEPATSRWRITVYCDGSVDLAVRTTPDSMEPGAILRAPLASVDRIAALVTAGVDSGALLAERFQVGGWLR
jgi:hypothetical protein